MAKKDEEKLIEDIKKMLQQESGHLDEDNKQKDKIAEDIKKIVKEIKKESQQQDQKVTESQQTQQLPKPQPPLSQTPRQQPSKIQTVKQQADQILPKARSTLSQCWKGMCKYIAVVSTILYVIIIVLGLTCWISDASFCLQSGFLGSPLYLIMAVIIMIIIDGIISLRSDDRLTALIFSLLFSIPAFVLILLSLAEYIGAILIAAVILSQIVRTSNR